jgi:DNA invertase Pin-like site-specific DNA recombinase
VAPTEVLDHLDAGDVLIVTRLDRLARSTRDLLNVLAAVGEMAPASRVSRMLGPIPQQPMAG